MKPLVAIAAIGFLTLTATSFAGDKASPAPYPLATCFISGEKLGEMGKPVVFDYNGQEMKLCCKDCRKKFDSNPGKYMKEFRDAVKKAGKSPSATSPAKGC